MKFRAIVVPFHGPKTIGWYFCQIRSEFACFSQRFTSNSAVGELDYGNPARKKVPVLQSRYSFR
jgi:hypothetical protein